GERVHAKLAFQLGHQQRQIERSQPERRAQLVVARQRAILAEPLLQERSDLSVNDRLEAVLRRRQHVIPPSTTRICPVMKDASADARKWTALATSSMRARRPSGVRRAMRCLSSSAILLTMSLSKYPGATELTRMLCGPSSRARLRVIPSSAALVAL